MNELVELYITTTGGEPAPLMEIRSDYVFNTKFHGDVEELYLYCIKNKIKWEEVLDTDTSIFNNKEALT